MLKYEISRVCREIEVLACRIGSEYSRVASEPDKLLVVATQIELELAALKLKELLSNGD